VCVCVCVVECAYVGVGGGRVASLEAGVSTYVTVWKRAGKWSLPLSAGDRRASRSDGVKQPALAPP
jgi:hypothetical protein